MSESRKRKVHREGRTGSGPWSEDDQRARPAVRRASGFSGQWKKEILDRAGTLFEGKRGPEPAAHADEDHLFGEIGRLKMEHEGNGRPQPSADVHLYGRLTKHLLPIP